MHLGLLQILFLAGVSEYAIQQHCEEERDGYNTTLFPLSGSIKGTIHIMWVKVDPEPPRICEPGTERHKAM